MCGKHESCIVDLGSQIAKSLYYVLVHCIARPYLLLLCRLYLAAPLTALGEHMQLINKQLLKCIIT